MGLMAARIANSLNTPTIRTAGFAVTGGTAVTGTAIAAQWSYGADLSSGMTEVSKGQLYGAAAGGIATLVGGGMLIDGVSTPSDDYSSTLTRKANNARFGSMIAGLGIAVAGASMLGVPFARRIMADD